MAICFSACSSVVRHVTARRSSILLYWRLVSAYATSSILGANARCRAMFYGHYVWPLEVTSPQRRGSGAVMLSIKFSNQVSLSGRKNVDRIP
jgi:hypothetical protein